jgi:FxsC-like protein
MNAMADNGDVRETPNISVLYFFLSYAHSDPSAGYLEPDPDQLVREFFMDLSAAIRRYASRQAQFVPGFFDQEIPVGSDWKKSLTRALGSAEVFVPLYSTKYVTKSLPGREWACFRKRMELAGLPDPMLRFVPVLWTPLAETQDPPGLQEGLALDPDKPDYAENGLRALLQIKSYHHSYQVVVDALAKRIVELAERFPVGPSLAPDIDKMESAFMPESHLAVFGIETAASSIKWRPFPQQELSLAEYAKQVAERLDFKAEVSGVKAVRDQGQPRPGIILIDPWFIADNQGKLALQSAVEKLPRWVLPLLIVNQPGDARTRELAHQVRDMLGDAKVLPTDSSRRGARGVSSLDEFVSIVRMLVAEADRQYLRYRSGRVPSRPSPPSAKRPRLGSGTHLDAPASAPDLMGEAPDA